MTKEASRSLKELKETSIYKERKRFMDIKLAIKPKQLRGGMQSNELKSTSQDHWQQ